MSDPVYIATGGLRVDNLITRQGEAHTGLPGGNALYAAAGALFWTDSVAIWARYGSNYPQQWLSEFHKLGLDIQGLLGVPGVHDHRTFYAYTPDGQRDDTNPPAHFARIGLPLPAALADYIHSTPGQDDPYEYEPLAPRPEDWPDSFAGAKAVHLSPLPLATHLHVANALRTQGRQRITLDPGERYMVPERIPYVSQILPLIDAFLPSDQEVHSLLGPGADLVEAARIFREWGAPVVVIKIGAEGILLSDEDHDHPLHLSPYHAPNDPRVIDVTGAGDAFCGGFMVGLAETNDCTTAAQMGLVSASLVIEGYSALFALKVEKEKARHRLREISNRGQ